ncbi:NYN domain-containing protein [Paracoccus sp. MC1854]|uniref:NYN domain-containing protein n=1 Tax=Paracoccus sp. MC1854 TaxID=2760306 RepID=UPI001602B8C4|nr:NYN domain-containing protein [Paracoccus sp. MC1854]MBB1492899.1 NYN domain-containing protein [Paracoccus sp. MC1854]
MADNGKRKVLHLKEYFKDYRWFPLEEAEKLARELVASPSVRYECRKTIFLIDLYGIYLRVTEWMAENRVPITTGELPSRIAAFLLWNAMEEVRKREQAEISFSGMDFQKLVGEFLFRREEDVPTADSVTHLDMRWELFYAHSPLKEIKRILKTTRSLDPSLERKLANLRKGIVETPYGTRDYRVYDDFIARLSSWLTARCAEPGFYNIRVNRGGVCLDEKEVDIRIAIRAMDIMAGNEADAVCIVSSDQDYMPLHVRIKEAGLKTYHADVAKFDMPDNIGRKIRGMGDDAIHVRMTPDIPHDLIKQYVQPPILLDLHGGQYEALWRIMHEMGGEF